MPGNCSASRVGLSGAPSARLARSQPSLSTPCLIGYGPASHSLAERCMNCAMRLFGLMALFLMVTAGGPVSAATDLENTLYLAVPPGPPALPTPPPPPPPPPAPTH